MTLTTKLLSALVFLVLLAPAYSDLLSPEQPSASVTVAYSATSPATKAQLSNTSQKNDAWLSVKKPMPARSAHTAVDKKAIS